MLSPNAYSIYSYGPHAWMITTKNKNDILSLHHLNHIFSKNKPEILKEWTLGYNSILLEFSLPTKQTEAIELIKRAWHEKSTARSTQRIHKIPTIYNGPDLEEVADETQLSIDEIISIHSSAKYTVRFLGFAPGFAYLDGLDPRLQIPRKNIPRERIDVGAVAIGGPHTSVYSIESPGGWHWLGNTSFPLFDLLNSKSKHQDSSFPLHIGDHVRFTPLPS